MTTRQAVGAWLLSTAGFFTLACVLVGDRSVDRVRNGTKVINRFDWGVVLTATGIASVVSSFTITGLALLLTDKGAT